MLALYPVLRQPSMQAKPLSVRLCQDFLAVGTQHIFQMDAGQQLQHLGLAVAAYLEGVLAGRETSPGHIGR